MTYLQRKKMAFMSLVNHVKGFVRTIFGVPPLTLVDCVDGDSIFDYRIVGSLGFSKSNTKNLSQKSPIHVYTHAGDYLRYNPENIAVLREGTYTISGSSLPMLQFWDIETQKYMLVTDTVKLQNAAYYSAWDGRMLLPSSPTIQQATFEILRPTIVTLAGDGKKIYDCQIEEGTVKTEYEESKNLNETSPIHNYDFNVDYMKYNDANKAILDPAGTYTISGSSLPILQFWDIETQKPLLVEDVVSSREQTYALNWGGRALIPAAANVNKNTFTISQPVIITLAGDGKKIYDCQIEKGSIKTEYEERNTIIGVGDKSRNLSQTSPIHNYDFNVDYTKYNTANEAILEQAGTYTISGSRLPILQFWDIETKEPLLVSDTVKLQNAAYYSAWDGRALLPSSPTIQQATFEILRPTRVTLSDQVSTIDDCQIEEGAVATEYNPFGKYVIPIVSADKNGNSTKTKIFLDAPLEIGESISFKVNDLPKLPTSKGTTVLSVDTKVWPGNMSVKYYSTSKE